MRNSLRPMSLACAALAWIGMILPATALAGAPPGQRTAARPPLIADVELDPGGVLHGVVVNARGVPLSRIPVVVRQARRELRHAETDVFGRFALTGLRGGTYQIEAGTGVGIFRVWVARTAPPMASRVAAIRLGDDVVRGQRPLGEAFTSDGLIIVGIVGAMIAIPIAVHQANRRSPSSP